MNSRVFNLLNSLGAMLIIAGAVFKILHLQYGNAVLIGGFIVGSFASYFYINNLKHRINQLEQELSSRQ